LKPSQVFAAGDHWNDLPMLLREYAHWLASPANAIDPVKTLVREQGGHVSELSCGSGVAEALQICLRKAGA
jgi:hydroxymethylpyrimidine pyrophosphatase-like HAD family hydrolase